MVLAEAGVRCRVERLSIYPRLRQYFPVVRHGMKKHFKVIIMLAMIASGSADAQSKTGREPDRLNSTHTQKTILMDYSPTLVKAHPKANELMKEDFYWSPVAETAPFGNDDGADSYAAFAEWRQSHKSNNPKEFLIEQINYWGYPSFDLYESNFERLKPYLQKNDLGNRFMSGIDAAIVAIAFGQLYLEGTIHKEFNELAQISIRRQLIPDLLGRWASSYIHTRESQLQTMLKALRQVP
jgi:uncharacterized protein YfeS